MKIHDIFFREEFVCNYKIKTMNPVQISIYDGFVMGGGVGVSIHSKVKIATETTVFAMPGIKLQFVFHGFNVLKNRSENRVLHGCQWIVFSLKTA